MTNLQKRIPDARIEESSEIHALGNNGKTVVYPESEQDIAEVLMFANDNNLKVGIGGSGSKRGFGGTEENSDIFLSLKQFKGIVEHSLGDMTMTVKPGTTMKEINEYLSGHKQKLSADPRWPEYATIGGVIAANDSGPKRLKYGSARDYVIGLRIVYPNGKVIRTGGKVVKNVAGYDMNKLFIGSMGTLGVISEVTLKLRPIPKYQSIILISFSEQSFKKAPDYVKQLHDSTLEPVSMELLNPELAIATGGKARHTLAVSFEDVEEAVRYQAEWLKNNRPSGTELQVLSGEDAEAWWNDFAKIPPAGCLEDDNEVLSVKIGSKNADVFPLVSASEEFAARHLLNVKVHGGTGHGISRVYASGNPENFIPFLKELRAEAESRGGYAIADHMPLAQRKELDIWGGNITYRPLLEGIKKSIDPNSILNHKRFAGGL
ncbi:FAD-binding oxidoreductase [Bacillus marinisedimentorum]|uniref:FAD-binding oxidoreductase n=1 Tax=Bacillus marinisedimentorum TaxID=1821260 RepID=UPI00316AC2AF